MEDFYGSQIYTTTHNLIRWKSGKRIEPRLLGLLESFGEIYVKRRGFFDKIFDKTYEELFETIGKALKRRKEMKKAKSLRRSMSMRAIGTRGIDEEVEGLRLERFKVKTPDVIVVGPDGPTTQGGSTQTTQGSTSDSK